jgi:hypothetical protein
MSDNENTDYSVDWTIDIFDAESPIDAARRAVEVQRNRSSIALVFDVTGPHGEVTRVDLLDGTTKVIKPGTPEPVEPTKTIKDLADAIIERLDAEYDLVYVNQGDQFSDEQVEHIVSGDYEKLSESTEEWESDSRHDAMAAIIKEELAAILREWEREDAEIDTDALESEFDGSEDEDRVRDEISQRDTGSWVKDLARATPDVLLRIRVVDEDDAYNNEAVDPNDALTKVGLPITEANTKLMVETLIECSPEYSILMGYFIVGADVMALLDLPSDTVELTIENPYVYWGNPFAGSGFISESAFEGTVTVKREDLHTDKGAFGYSVTEVYGGLTASSFSAKITPVAVVTDETKEN